MVIKRVSWDGPYLLGTESWSWVDNKCDSSHMNSWEGQGERPLIPCRYERPSTTAWGLAR